MRRGDRNAFTLVEVMIVVVIMAIIAAILVTSGNDLTGDARVANARFNQHTLQSQIEMYRAQHDGRAPTATLVELVSRTDGTGSVGTGPECIYGPYLAMIPANPYTRSNIVRPASGHPPTASGAGDAGWLYEVATGKVWVDRADLLVE